MSLRVAVVLGLDVACLDSRYVVASFAAADVVKVSGALRAAVMMFLLKARRRRDRWVARWNQIVMDSD